MIRKCTTLRNDPKIFTLGRWGKMGDFKANRFSLIVACDRDGGIGKSGEIPWDLPTDLGHFYSQTKGKSILMGRKTWESLPKRPLPDRHNIVITRQKLNPKDATVTVLDDLETGLDELAQGNGVVIGGGEIYRKCLSDARLTDIWITRLEGVFDCDTFFPLGDVCTETFCLQKSKEYVEHDIKFFIEHWTRHNLEEKAYLNLLQTVLDHGQRRDDRTGTGVLSIFSPPPLSFSLEGGCFPLLTTKKVFFRGIVEELLWFLSGSTDVRLLEDRGIKIWTPNSTPAFMKQRGLEEWAGTIGKGYGHQLRHWGGTFHGPFSSSKGGIDQIEQLIKDIKTNPTSRRLILNVWNVGELDEMALPPCHLLPCQFWVDMVDKTLHCKWYQRSADLFLGLPFNIASYALLTRLIAKETGLAPGKIHVSLGDAHVYLTHLDSVRAQLGRMPFPFPFLSFHECTRSKTLSLTDLNHPDSLYRYISKDFILGAYRCHPRLFAEMAV